MGARSTRNSGVPGSAAMSNLLKRLDRSWFAPASLVDLASVRVALVCVQLVLLLVPAIAYTVGACPGCTMEFHRDLVRVDPTNYLPIPALKVLMLPFGPWGSRPELMFLQAVWILAVVTGITSLVGLYTRPSLLAFAAANTLLTAHSYSYGEFHHTEALITIAFWALAFGPSGEALSLDSLGSRLRVAVGGMRFTPVRTVARESTLARWPLLLMQWCLALSYISAGLAKLLNGGFAWFNGYSLAYYIGADAVSRHSSLGLWFASHIPLLSVLAVLTVVIELTFVLAILFPRLALWYVLLGTGMHVGIYLLQRAPFPQTVALYIVFIEALRRQLGHRFARSRAAASWTVVYDGRCPLCLRTMVMLDAADWRHRLAVVDLESEWPRLAAVAPSLTTDQARLAMHVIGPDGTVHRGFFAFRELAGVLPVLWPLWPLLHLPGLGRLGPWVYQVVAGRRTRHVCAAEVCEI